MTASFIKKIWLVLVVLLLVSIALGYLPNATLATVLVFAVATIKAGLVIAYYMGAKSEPKYITYILLSGMACMLILFFVLVPDIIFVYGG